MFTELNSILNTSPSSFTQGDFILVSGRQSDASFLIHHFLSFYLRARCKVCFLGLVQSFSHYSAVCQRLGVSLAQAKEKRQLVFLEGLQEGLTVFIPQDDNTGSKALSFLRDPAVGLQNLYDFVLSSVSSPGGGEEGSDGSEQWGPPVLLVDDLSVLLSLGVSARAVLDFSHYCRASLCSQQQSWSKADSQANLQKPNRILQEQTLVAGDSEQIHFLWQKPQADPDSWRMAVCFDQGNVVMLLHCEEEEDEDDGDDEGSERLLKGLVHQCSLALHVQGLPTGYCRDIHGQVEVCWRRRQGDGQHTQNKVFQYKVHDKGASFFARGTSSAVL